MARIKLFIPLLIFVVLAALLYLGLGHDPRELPSALVGRPVPAFALPALGDGKPLDATLFRGGPRLLNVWGTWCSACRDEHPFLVALAARGIPIVGLDYKDDPAAARRWLADMGNPYQAVIADDEGRLGLDLGVYGAPETYVVDAAGIIRYRHVGVLNEQIWRERIEPVYRQWLAP
ncbi:MAG: DsbE family thiol:disulfide interchange protein [Porticoccaceae bacterium]